MYAVNYGVNELLHQNYQPIIIYFSFLNFLPGLLLMNEQLLNPEIIRLGSGVYIIYIGFCIN